MDPYEHQRQKASRKASRKEALLAAQAEAAERESKLAESLSYKLKRSYCGDFERVMAKKAPKLLKNLQYRKAIENTTVLYAPLEGRNLADWKPRGKGYDALFVSLCEHFWAVYPTPPFVWSALFEDPGKASHRWLAKVVIDLAAGESLFKMSKEGRFPVSLTRAMVHDLMTRTPKGTRFVDAVRRTQVKFFGGSPALYTVWSNSRVGRDIGGDSHLPEGRVTHETFWASVLLWLCRNPWLDLNQTSPLIDFIAYRRRMDPDFSMKGRSPMAMIRGMEEWHKQLGREADVSKRSYQPSGFSPLLEKDDPEWENWRVSEILSSAELIKEGRELRHCVASYAWSVERGERSIWSMGREERGSFEKVITIEVDNRLRKVVQARGTANRMIQGGEEFTVLKKWSDMNGLGIELGRW